MSSSFPTTSAATATTTSADESSVPYPSTSSSSNVGRPIICQLDDERRMFKILRAKGKALSSGGFGVTITDTDTGRKIRSRRKQDGDYLKPAADELVVSQDSPKKCQSDLNLDNGTNDTAKIKKVEGSASVAEVDYPDRDHNDKNEKGTADEKSAAVDSASAGGKNPSRKGAKPSSHEYLFIEEVVFLHERGLLDCLPSTNSYKAVGEGNMGKNDTRSCDIVDDDNDKGERSNMTPSSTNRNETCIPFSHTFLDSSQLYMLLPKLGITLPMYFVYAHLRSQDFRVLRHCPNRYELLCQQNEMKQALDKRQKKRQRSIDDQQTERQQHKMGEQSIKQQQQQHQIQSPQEVIDKVEVEEEEDNENENDTKHNVGETMGDSKSSREMSAAKKMKILRHSVRESIRNSKPPVMLSDSSSSSSSNNINDNVAATTNASRRRGRRLNLAWDCYLPNTHFAKTHPGFPDFYVAVTFYQQSLVSFPNIASLLEDYCHGIPLKLACVSDSGTVLMFGVTDFGVPHITTTRREETKSSDNA